MHQYVCLVFFGPRIFSFAKNLISAEINKTETHLKLQKKCNLVGCWVLFKKYQYQLSEYRLLAWLLKKMGAGVL
jgi:hypothetical protein